MANYPDLNGTELEIMKILWKNGRQSAREIHDAQKAARSYSTTRTLIDRMAKKGLVRKEAFHGMNLYEAVLSKASGLAGLVKYFASQVLEMGPGPVVSLLADSQTLEPEELEELTRILESES